MDSGFNMLGQFQGDSSLGLGSFQGNSQPSTRPLTLRPTGYFKDIETLSVKDGNRRVKQMVNYLDWFKAHPEFDEDLFSFQALGIREEFSLKISYETPGIVEHYSPFEDTRLLTIEEMAEIERRWEMKDSPQGGLGTWEGISSSDNT